MKVYCVFSLESPQRGDFNDYTQYTIPQYKKENHPKLSQICNYGLCSKGPKNEFEPAVVNEPSVFEPLEFDRLCIFDMCVIGFNSCLLGEVEYCKDNQEYWETSCLLADIRVSF